MPDMIKARALMVAEQVERRGVIDPQLLDAMREVPREAFVPEALESSAYDDRPLPIEAGQTISQPYIVGLMIEAARVRSGDRVLEIGAGSGYAAAVLSRLAAQVYAVERHAVLGKLAEQRLKRLGYSNVEICIGDGSEGWPEAGPFDAIMVAAAGPSVPRCLMRQLAPGGRLVMPIGEHPLAQRLVKLTRSLDDKFEQEDLGGVVFVPLIGVHGWAEASGRPPVTIPTEPEEASTLPPRPPEDPPPQPPNPSKNFPSGEPRP